MWLVFKLNKSHMRLHKFFLIVTGDWRGIVHLYDNGFCDEKLLWFQPNTDGMSFLKKNLADLGVKGVSSIGCGTGLLEWLINSSTGTVGKMIISRFRYMQWLTTTIERFTGDGL